MRLEQVLQQQLDALAAGQRLRTVPQYGEDNLRNVASNDYLGLAHTGWLDQDASSSGWPVGAGASRLLTGTHDQHERLESELADWLGATSALLFSSGYAANLGAIQALAGPELEIFSDQLNHASIVDGCRLAKAAGSQVTVVPHLALGDLRACLAGSERKHRLVVTEAYFSMDGDSPDLAALSDLCREFDAWLAVDEAHSLGTFGPAGRGLSAALGVAPDLLIGTLGKALGGQGAFVVGSATLRQWLWNRARSFVFSTAPSPALCAELRARLRRVRDADAARERLATLCDALDRRLRTAGIRLPKGRHGPIFPIVVGSSEAALEAASAMAERGFRAPAVRPPTVPEGQARLRVTLNSTLSEHDLDELADAVVSACGC